MNVLKFPTKKINKKKLAITITVGFILLLFIIIWIIYSLSATVRSFFDIYIFRKQIDSDKLATIEINSDEDCFYHAYDKYIAVLSKNILYSYNSSGQISAQNDVLISTPIFANNNKFLAIAENNGNTIYLLSGTNIVFQKTLDGNISKMSVNKNGYLSIIVSGSSYKSIVIVLSPDGTELFRTYLSNTMAICTDISNDNKYLSVGEINYSGSIVQSIVRNISIETAKSDPSNSVLSTFNIDENILLTNIHYQDKNTLICFCNDCIISYNIADSSSTKIFDFNNGDYEFIDINIKNHFICTYNSLKGFINTSIVDIINVYNGSANQYKFTGSIKSIVSNNEKIAINAGNEVHFISLNGWLIKKYESYYEINTILVGDSIAGIAYKNRIEIIEI